MGKPHGNSRLAKIGRPILRQKRRPGAPKGNANALRHGGFSAEAAVRRSEIGALIAETEELIAFIDYVAAVT